MHERTPGSRAKCDLSLEKLKCEAFFNFPPTEIHLPVLVSILRLDLAFPAACFIYRSGWSVTRTRS
ncbi:MAG TPA: hypothetical protein VFE33_28540 [Thermoanaerobaculia bacterium]|nr:hypothetical protein [Thermoanaerobaculia bacterium]